MSVEIPCPQCGSILKAPEGMAGKKARCKKCQHSFRIPGSEPTTEPNLGPETHTASIGEESTQLSVVEQPAFSFEAPTAEDSPEDPTEPKSRGKYKSSTVMPAKRSSSGSRQSGSRHKADSSKSGAMLLLSGIAAVVVAGGAGAYFLTNSSKPELAQSSAAKPPAPEKDKDAAKAPVKETVKNKTKDETKADRKLTVEKGPDVKAGTGKAIEPKPGDTKQKKGIAVSGGIKLPAPPAKADKFTKPIAKVSTDHAFTPVKRLFVSGGDNPVAVVVWASDAGFQGKGAKDTVDRYSLASGDRIDRTEVDSDAGLRASDLSPNGEQFIQEGPAGTLTLYDLNGKQKSGKPFKPFASDDAKAPPQVLTAAYFADEKTVITVAKSGLLEGWNVREGTKTESGSIGAVADYVAGHSLGIKSDRSMIVAVAGETVFEVSTKSLQSKSVMTLPKGSDKAYAAALSDTGDQVAVAYRATTPGPHTMIAVVRIGDAKVTTFHMDESNGLPEMLDWCGPECFVTAFDKNGTALAFDTEVKRPLATLWPGGPAKHAVANGKHYTLMADPADAKKCLLLGVDFPPDDYLPLRNEAVEAKAPVGFLLTAEGIGR
ncbi:hypothetical protein BH11PLA2_BH11PLA2_36650 [soil metagenome]